MSCIVLTHLGQSIPLYIEDCVKQIRLWNTCPIYLLLEGVYHRHTPFFTHLQQTYDVKLIYTESLKPTEHHLKFLEFFNDPKQKELLAFRKGYWKFVKERFFFLEELMLARELTDVLSMEYDILVYGDIRQILLHKFQTSHQTIRVVKDNDVRGHPGFMYIPSPAVIEHFNIFLNSLLHLGMEDMQTLCMYGEKYPTRLNYLPCITEETNRKKSIRKSLDEQHTVENAWYLSQDSEHFNVLFDSAVIGQALGGIDPRNTGGKKFSPYLNEAALYSFTESPGGWAKDERNRWFPVWDNRRILTIHMHSKALTSFLSSREDMPRDDYKVEDVLAKLEKN